MSRGESINSRSRDSRSDDDDDEVVEDEEDEVEGVATAPAELLPVLVSGNNLKFGLRECRDDDDDDDDDDGPNSGDPEGVKEQEEEAGDW
jgi:hypothetical protein